MAVTGTPGIKISLAVTPEVWDEEAGVQLALHPNDPPVPEIGGIPCLIHSFEGYKRAYAIANSDNLGMEFCVG